LLIGHDALPVALSHTLRRSPRGKRQNEARRAAPDDNGVELYWDRPQQEWPLTADGKLAMFTHRLDLANLLAEADRAPGAQVDAPLFEPSRGT
jgi:hypothetical protein